LGAKFLVVLCAGFALLLVEDALTRIVNGALVGVSLGLQASPSGVWLFPTGLTYLGFITERKFVDVLITPSLGVSNWPVFYIINTVPPTSFLALLPGKNKTSARGVSHAHPLLCFKFYFTLFLLASFLSKTQKN
jgi:hypothetical protein